MAFPTIPTGAQIISALQANTTATRTFPDLSGLTKSSGDLLIAIVFAYQTGTGTDAAFSGWTGSFTEFADRATTTTMAIGMAYKWSTGSETGTFAVTQAGTITGHAAMLVMAIPGAHASTIPEAGTKTDGTSGAADIAALNPANWDVEDTLWIAVGGSGEVATTSTYFGMSNSALHLAPWTTVTLPANYTNGYATGVTQDAAGGVEGAVGFRQLAAASADPAAFAPDLSNARNSSLLIAVRPMPVVTGVGLGAFTFTGAGAGVPGVTGAAAKAVTFTGTANGVPGVVGSAAKALTFGATASGVPGVPGVAAGVFIFTGEAAGTVTPGGPITGVGLGGYTFGSMVNGVPGVTGQASAAVTFGATASGVPGVPGQGAAPVVFGATAQGVPGVPGVALGSFTFTGAAIGEIVGKITGEASAPFSFGALASGVVGHDGAAAGAWTFGGAGTGVPGHEGAALATLTFTATGVGVAFTPPPIPGVALGAFIFTATAIVPVMEGPIHGPLAAAPGAVVVDTDSIDGAAAIAAIAGTAAPPALVGIAGGIT